MIPSAFSPEDEGERGHEQPIRRKKPPVSGRLVEAGVQAYFSILYVRSPASFLVEEIGRSIFLVRVPEMNPRMLWFCQPVAFAISAMVAPPLR